MGNQLGLPQRFEQDHLADVPFVVFKEQLGQALHLVAALFSTTSQNLLHG